MSSATAHVAEFAARAAVPQSARDPARKALVDTLGCMLAGAKSEVAAPLAAYVKRHHARGPAIVLGTGFNVPAEIAALVNGTFGHALDFDDGIVLAPVHPSSVMIAALLADADGLTGRALLDAYVVGVEVAVRLATAIGIDHYHHGWHGTGTLGIFGAVAALAHARKLDPAVTRTAVGLAASMTSGVQRNFGTMAKPLHSGWAARNAVVAVELASSGYSAAADALEADNGFFAVYGNAGTRTEALEALGDPYVVETPGLSLKRYACCYASHRPMEGLLAIRDELALTADDVEKVECFLAPGSLRALIYRQPTNGLEGKFSLEYALAAGVLDGRYSLWSFSDEAVARPEAQALLPRIEVSEHARCAEGDPHAATRGPSRRGFVEVHVHARDGRHAMRRVDALPGSPDQPLSWDDVRAKFLDCARSAAVDQESARTALDRLTTLEDCADVAGIVAMLRAPA